MSLRNQYVTVFNWQSTSPITNFLPNNNTYGSTPSGILNGTMSGTNTIWSNIIDFSRMKLNGLTVAWTGTPTGTFQILCSSDGINFPAMTFAPALNQPVGSANSMGIQLQSFPWKWMLLEYTNASGSGVLTVTSQNKD